MKFHRSIVITLALLPVIGSAVGGDRVPKSASGVDLEASVVVAPVYRNRAGFQTAQSARFSLLPEAKARTGPVPTLPIANPGRSYPPSCLAEPLPDVPSGPTYSNPNVTLLALDRVSGTYTLERVAITLWRVSCSSSRSATSATLMRIQRQASLEGSTAIYPLLPLVRYSQGSITFDDSDQPLNLARLSLLPNTLSNFEDANTPIITSKTYVLENLPSLTGGPIDFNLAFRIRIDNGSSVGTRFYYIDLPAYNPTASTYPAVFQDLPISGYMATNWYDPMADGEGITLQVHEPAGDTRNLVVSFSWAAYDPDGIPFWLAGQATITRGAKTADATLFYRTGGGLGGNRGPAGAPIIWGTASVSFPDCNSMVLTYASKPGLPLGVPSGSGTRSWTRVANMNGLACE
jgi:hypothetical protein